MRSYRYPMANALLWYWHSVDLAAREKAGGGSADWLWPEGAFGVVARIELERLSKQIPPAMGIQTLVVGGADD